MQPSPHGLTYENLHLIHRVGSFLTGQHRGIDGLIDIYKSPTGQALTNKMPAVTQKAMSAVQTQMQQVMPRIEAAMDKLLAELKAAK